MFARTFGKIVSRGAYMCRAGRKLGWFIRIRIPLLANRLKESRFAGAITYVMYTVEVGSFGLKILRDYQYKVVGPIPLPKSNPIVGTGVGADEYRAGRRV
jgi:hypothetical protein